MIRGVDHIGIAVHSIEEGRKLYEAMGLRVEAIEEVPAEGVRVAFIPIGNTRIELLESIAADSPVAKFLVRRGPGIHHVCLASDDLPADDSHLRAAGIEVLRPELSSGAGGMRVQFIHPKSAGGVLFELSEPDPEAHPEPEMGGGQGE
jgi:methylmalonyl-CoA epimerase